MYTIDQLSELSIDGVYCLYCNEYAYFGYSANILVAIAGIIREIKDGSFKIIDMRDKPLNIRLFPELGSCDDIEAIKLRTQAKAIEYEGLGWKIWNPAIKSLLKYEVVLKVNVARKSVDVVLRTAGRTEKLVGVFDSIAEASEFMGTFYSPFTLPVYACNSRTSEEFSKVIRGTR